MKKLFQDHFLIKHAVVSSGNQAHRDFMNLREKQPACETSNLGVDDVDNSKQRRIIQANGGRNPLAGGIVLANLACS